MNKTEERWVSRIKDLLSLKSKLLGRDVSSEELADFVGVSRQTIYTWMSPEGVPTISAEKTARVAEFFNVPVWRVWELYEVETSDDDQGQAAAVPAA